MSNGDEPLKMPMQLSPYVTGSLQFRCALPCELLALQAEEELSADEPVDVLPKPPSQAHYASRRFLQYVVRLGTPIQFDKTQPLGSPQPPQTGTPHNALRAHCLAPA